MRIGSESTSASRGLLTNWRDCRADMPPIGGGCYWVGRKAERSAVWGVRPLGSAVCEMKRLFVRPAFRGQGMGRHLAQRAVEEARAIGYLMMKLDTLPAMQSAINLYARLGFVRCGAYYDTPLVD